MNSEKAYWAKRYRRKETGWDLGAISPPLKAYIDQISNKNLRILIPGAGNAYEAEYLFQNGFSNVYVLDLAEEPLINFKSRVPDFPRKNLLQEDFFSTEGTYDLILEQTFFCAVPVEKRPTYVEKVAQLLSRTGKIVGVFFSNQFPKDGPPFGGSKKEYEELFKKTFRLQLLEPCYNSIPPRMGKELFFIFSKKLEPFMSTTNIILNNEQIQQKIKRIAYQIYENNVDEEQIILAGIANNGYEFARKLKIVLEEISELKVELCQVKVDKKNPLNEVKTSIPSSSYRDKSLILIDDVLNSGTTLIYGVKHFLDVPLKQFKTAVLVDRSHKKYPVKADFKGISLSTSLNETVKVKFAEGKDKAELL